MKKYTQKDRSIEAVKFDGTLQQAQQLFKEQDGIESLQISKYCSNTKKGLTWIVLYIRDGMLREGDYLVRDGDELIVLSKDVFEDKYVEVD